MTVFFWLQVLGDGDCLYNSVLCQLFMEPDTRAKFTVVYFKRMIVAHVCENIDLLAPKLKEEIMYLYGSGDHGGRIQ